MLKFLLIFCLLLGNISSISKRDINTISLLLSKKQHDKRGSFKTKTFYEIRKELFRSYPLLLKNHGETLFFLEKYDLESATYLGLIWDKTDTINFSYFAKKISIDKNKSFSSKSIEWISNWDTVSIRNEELHYPNTQKTVWGARCKILNGKYFIEVIQFKEFVFFD